MVNTIKASAATTVDEIGNGIYRIHTPIPGFSFNQYLILDEKPLLFHTGLRNMFSQTCEAIKKIMPIERLDYIAFSHFEADECGALNEFLAVAPNAVPVCSAVAAMTSIGDFADRAPQPLKDGEKLSTGKRQFTWLDAPHVPHGWECGYMMEETTKTFFCGDIFTQPGDSHPAITQADILEPSEALRHQMEYYAHAKNTTAILEKMASFKPTTLAVMHGSAWTGDGASLLKALSARLARS